MKTVNEIKKQIEPSLIEIETFREEKLNAAKQGRTYYIIPIILGIPIVLFSIVQEEPALIFFSIAALVVVTVMISHYKVQVHINAYKKEYKKQILTAFINKLYPEANYFPEKHIDSRTFDISNLFQKHNRYKGEDYFKGKTESGNSFEFSELDVKYRTSGKNSNTRTVFKGLFFVLETNDTIDSEVYVLPDFAEKKFGNTGKYFQKTLGGLFNGSKMVYMEKHPEFEKEFVVYSKKETDAYRVLSPTMIDAICHLKYNWNVPIHIGFINNKIYIGIPSHKDYFKPTIEKSVREDSLLEEFYNELAACFSVIEDMSEIEKLPRDYNPSKNWNDSAYDHLLDNDNSFFS